MTSATPGDRFAGTGLEALAGAGACGAGAEGAGGWAKMAKGNAMVPANERQTVLFTNSFVKLFIRSIRPHKGFFIQPRWCLQKYLRIKGFNGMGRDPSGVSPHIGFFSSDEIIIGESVMKHLIRLLGLVVLVGALVGCVWEPAGYAPAGGVSVGVYGEYPYTYYGHGGYYQRWHHPYDRDYYFYRPHRYWY